MRRRTRDRLFPFKDEIIRLYVEEKKSAKKIAEIFDASSSLIWGLLHEWDVRFRRPLRKGLQNPVVNGQRQCCSCRIWKPLSDFSICRITKLGIQPRCKFCAKTIRRDTRYNLTSSQYQEFWNAQAGVCGICGQPETASIKGKSLDLAVDHNHETGVVRELLCHRCNRTLGGVHENVELLQNMIAYIEKHSPMVSNLPV